MNKKSFMNEKMMYDDSVLMEAAFLKECRPEMSDDYLLKSVSEINRLVWEDCFFEGVRDLFKELIKPVSIKDYWYLNEALNYAFFEVPVKYLGGKTRCSIESETGQLHYSARKLGIRKHFAPTDHMCDLDPVSSRLTMTVIRGTKTELMPEVMENGAQIMENYEFLYGCGLYYGTLKKFDAAESFLVKLDEHLNHQNQEVSEILRQVKAREEILYFSPLNTIVVRIAIMNVNGILSKPKIGRNALCPCGSGKKFKNCCGRIVS